MSRHRDTGRWGWGVWAAALVVALGAGVATAHGLYEVALAAGVPVVIAGLYPLITDGLALVAYAATARLRAGGRGYAWTVVVLAAGLSGLAQAAYLAGGVATSASTVLRFGVGAWPAIAAAIVAHLLYLLGSRHEPTAVDTAASTDVVGSTAGAVQPAASPAGHPVPPSNPVRPAAASNAERVTVQSAAGAGVQPKSDAALVQPALLDALPAGDQVDGPTDGRASSAPGAQPVRERARAVARHHVHRHGRLPTVSELMTLAEVSRGTAGTALQELRELRTPLHLVSATSEASDTP